MTKFRTLEVGWRYSEVARRAPSRTFFAQVSPEVRALGYQLMQQSNRVFVQEIRPQIHVAWR